MLATLPSHPHAGAELEEQIRIIVLPKDEFQPADKEERSLVSHTLDNAMTE